MGQNESEELKNLIFHELEKFKDQQQKDGKAILKAVEILEKFDDKLTGMKAIPLSTDLTPVNELIEEQNSKTRTIIASMPKAISRDYNFHLFPKINIKEYYTTYSRLMVYAAILLLAAAIANVGSEWIKGYNQRQDNLEQIEALKRYEENEYQIEIEWKKSKASIFLQSPILQKARAVNDKIAQFKKKEMDSIKRDLEKRVFIIAKDSVHK